jgi:hypothetical protein
MPNEIFSTNTELASPEREDRRRAARMELQFPLFVRARGLHDDKVMELAKTLNISRLGAYIVCPPSFAACQQVTLTIPVPSITSSPLIPSEMRPIDARVMRREEAGDVQLIGVEFLAPLL